MTDQTDKDLACQLIAALIPLGAQWAELEAVVHGDHANVLKAFGEQLAEIERLARLEVAENERLRSLITEMREAAEDFMRRTDAWTVARIKGTQTVEDGFALEAAYRRLTAILAKTESP